MKKLWITGVLAAILLLAGLQYNHDRSTAEINLPEEPKQQTEKQETGSNSHDEAVHSRSPEPSIPEVEEGALLTKEEMLEDFEHMYTTLEENYPLFRVLKRTQYVDWLGNYDEYRKRVEACTSDRMFYETMDGIINEFRYTGHTELLTPERYTSISDLYTSLEMEPWVTVLSGENSEKHYKNWAQIISEEDSVDGESVTVSQEAEETDAAENIAFGVFEDLDTAYVQIKSFGNAYMAQDIPRLTQFFEDNQDRANLIIDIRNNGGGSMDYWHETVRPLLKTTLRYPLRIAFKDGEVNRTFGFDSKSAQPIETFPELPSTPPELLETFDYYFEYEHALRPVGTGMFQNKPIVLMNEGNYSSSESFLIFAKATDWATLVGRRSSGDGVGQDPSMFALPNSGLVVKFASGMGLNPDGSSSEERGTRPDIWVRSGEDALEKTLDMIRDGELPLSDDK